MDDDDMVTPAPPSMAWLFTFADLVSLLITFFVLLFSMKEVNEGQWAELIGVLNGMFTTQQVIFDTRPMSVETVESRQRMAADNLTYVQNILMTRLANDPVLSKARTFQRRKENVLVLSLPTQLLFNSGESGLTAEGAGALSRLADVLRHLDNAVEVAGHTDPYPILSEKYPTNWELGMMRAIKVAKIVEDGGYVGHVPAVSYGASRYGEIDPSLPRAERNAKARRVDIMIQGVQQ